MNPIRAYSSSRHGLAALCVRRDGVDSLYYVHPDRLGSYTHITNAGKQVVRALPVMRSLPFSAPSFPKRMVWIFFVLLPPFLKYPKY
jgi:hypothetical protein